MKKKFSNLFKKLVKYVILLILIVLFIQFSFDIRIVAKLNIFNSNNTYINKKTVNSNKSIDFKISLDVVNSLNDFAISSNQNSLENLKINPILIDDFNLFIRKNQIQNVYPFRNDDFLNKTSKNSLPNCPFLPPNLVGRVKVDEKEHSFYYLEKKYSNDFSENSGGHWKPLNCLSHSKVAIIVPYRDREHHLKLFINHMHTFLKKQLIDYAIYIIEEAPLIPFNRAMLMNIGFSEALKDYDWSCFIFHDVDLVPEDDRNFYFCPYYPRHMSANVNTFKYELPYKEIMGGVTAINKDQFKSINGFSNSYFGWGGEDDDFSERVLSHNLKIIRYPDYISRYYMLSHKKDVPSKQRYNLLESAKKRFKTDGLNNLNYKVIKKVHYRLYTWLLVSFDYPNEYKTE